MRSCRFASLRSARTTQENLLDHIWFVTAPSNSKRSPLQRFHESSKKLAVNDELPAMALYTNRQIVHHDPILRHLDGVTDQLVPRLSQATPGSQSGRARAEWADHLGVDEGGLVRLLGALQIKAGRTSLDELCETCGMLMQAVGLRGDADAVILGVAAIRALIIEGCRELTADQVRQIIAAKSLAASDRRATLRIQAIDRISWIEGATQSVDWVEFFPGSEPRERRRPADPALWERRMKPELRAAAGAIKDAGYRDVHLVGV
jgi:hypothetical protein